MDQITLLAKKYGIQREVVEGWQKLYDLHRPHLQENHKHALDVSHYVMKEYPLRRVYSPYAIELMEENALKLKGAQAKETEGEPLQVEVYQVEETGKGKELYDLQEQEHNQTMMTLQQAMPGFMPYDFSSQPIVIGFEFTCDYVFSEGSQKLSDEIIMYRGLSKEELDNIYLVADYIETMQRYGKL